MIDIRARITNPWGKNNFKNIYCTSGDLTKNKAWEFEITYYSPTLLGFVCTCNFRGRDHAGLRLELGLLGYSVTLNVYDTRHWDIERDCWEVYLG